MTTEESTPVSAQPAQPLPPDAPAKPAEPPNQKRKLRPVIASVGSAVILLVALPRILHALHTVSTDDAYVNGYVTFVAPRVEGQVARVLVEDNNHVKKGDVLVELDPEPYRVQVAIKQAAVDAAKADLAMAEATVHSQIGQARGLRFKLAHAIEEVDNQVAVLRERVATWEQSKATRTLAQTEFDRVKKLLASKVASQEEFDKKRAELDVAEAQVKQALQNIYQARAALGLSTDVPEDGNLAEVPADIDQTFSTVRQGLSELMQGVSQLGVFPMSYNVTPKQAIETFYKRDKEGNIDRIYTNIMNDAPALKQAQAGLMRAQRDLDQAKLDLRYCTIVAEIDGVVTRRNVNPGNHAQVGQTLMAIRSLRDIWVDANFKETQLRDLRIGQRVDLDVDMYGRKRKFEGRISGFTMGTGSTLSLLPPENATGNFVKVVQRLPVRIDIVNYDDSSKFPLFIGLSVKPSVDLRSKPSGPNAGRFLQEAMDPVAAASPGAGEQ